MDSWPYTLISYTPGEVQEHCVNNPVWQAFRRSMKTKPTTVKLDMLEKWYTQTDRIDAYAYATLIQVSNYINALKRGGQLSMDLKVQR